MRLDDLLQVMRDEFALAADHIDSQLMAWLGNGPASADSHASAMAAELDRVATTARLVSLEGLALALEQLQGATLALAMLDEDTMGTGLGWLSSWRAPFESSFGAPGAAAPADELLAFLASGPLAPDEATLAALRSVLVLAPALPAEAADLSGPLPAATDADVSLAVPADVDHDLLETFLADAPAQVARLSDAVRTLVREGLATAAILEAQRVRTPSKAAAASSALRAWRGWRTAWKT